MVNPDCDHLTLYITLLDFFQLSKLLNQQGKLIPLVIRTCHNMCIQLVRLHSYQLWKLYRNIPAPPIPFITLFGEISVRIMSSVSMLPLTAILLQRNITVVWTKDMRITKLSSTVNLMEYFDHEHSSKSIPIHFLPFLTSKMKHVWSACVVFQNHVMNILLKRSIPLYLPNILVLLLYMFLCAASSCCVENVYANKKGNAVIFLNHNYLKYCMWR